MNIFVFFSVDKLTDFGQAEATTTTNNNYVGGAQWWLIDRFSTMAVAECGGGYVGGPIQQG